MPPHSSLLLLAGGVGINPHLSILSWLSQSSQHRQYLKSVKLLYASREDGLAFVDRLSQYSNFLSTELFLTGAVSNSANSSFPTQHRRLEDQDVLKALQDMPDPLVYICGPTQMTDHLEDMLSRGRDYGGAGLSKDCIRLEKWW